MGSLEEIRHDLWLYRRLAGAKLRGQMQYKLSFALQLIGVFAINSMELATIFILFQHFETLGGWKQGEIAFLYSLSAISFSIAKVLGSGFDAVGPQIARGEFDRILIRPVSPFIQVLTAELRLHQVGRLLQGLLAFGLSLSMIEIDWTPVRLLYLPVTIVSAAILFLALFTFETILCFWTTQATEAINAFTYGGTTLAQYPLHIFDLWLRRLFLWVIPLGFTIFLPALYLLDKPDPLGLPALAQGIAPLVAALFWIVAAFFWRLGIRHYRSTGS